MDKMTYEQRVKMVADEMARIKHPSSFKLYNKYKDQPDNGWNHEFYVKNWPQIVEPYMTLGRIAVAKMAEAASHFLGSLSEYGVSVRLTQYGLIPNDSKNNNT